MIKKGLILLLSILILAGFVGSVLADTPSIILPANSALKPDGSRVYLPDQVENRILVINAATGWPVPSSPIYVGGTPRGLVVSPDGAKLYVTVTTATALKVKAYDTSTNNFSEEITLDPKSAGENVNGIAITPDGNYLYVAEESQGKVYIINKQLTSSSSIITPQPGIYGVAVKPDGSRLYVSNRLENQVYVYNIENPTQPSYIKTIYDTVAATYLIAGDVSINATPGATEPQWESKTYLFVKVNEKSDAGGQDYRDVRVYDTADDNMSNVFNISVYNDYKDLTTGNISMPAHGSDPNNDFDGMTLGPNGAFFYLSHWNAGFVDQFTPDDQIHKLFVYAYSVDKCVNEPTDVTEKTWMVNSVCVPGTSKDSIIMLPDGRGIWRNFSSGADYFYEGYPDPEMYLGYNDEGDYPVIPGKPTFTIPQTGDVLENVNISWQPPAPNLTYILEYITGEAIKTNNWISLSQTTETSLNVTDWYQLEPYKNYYLRVKAYDGADTDPSVPGAFSAGNFGPYAYAGPFQKALKAPTHLTVAEPLITVTTATATWWAVGGAQTYTISWWPQDDPSALQSETIDAIKWFTFNGTPIFVYNTSYKMENLIMDKPYYVTVRASANGGSGNYATPVSFNTSDTLGVPQNVEVKDITMTGATVSWWKVDGANSYEVKLDKEIQARVPWTPVSTVSTSGVDAEGQEITWVSFNNLDADKLHRVKVRAFYNDIPGAYSDYVTFETSDTLSTPEGITVYDITMGSAWISWEAVPGAEDYRIQYAVGTVPLDSALVPSGHVKQIEISADKTWAKMPNLSPGQTYHARVQAFIPDGYLAQDGPWGYSDNFDASTVLTAPNSATIDEIGATTAKATWEVVDGATGYTVAYGYQTYIIDPFTGQKILGPMHWDLTTVEGQSTTWVDLPPVGEEDSFNFYPEKEYYVKVRADREGTTFSPQYGNYTNANPYPFTTLAGDQIAPPEGVTVYDISYASAWVSWESVADVAASVGAKYIVHVVSNLNGDDFDIDLVTTMEGEDLTWTKLEGLVGGTPYTVTVTSYLAPGQVSDPSEPVAFTTLSTLPVPQGFTIYDKGLVSVMASWEAVDGADSYEVVVKKGSVVVGYYSTSESNAEGNPFTWLKITGLEAGENYTATIQAKNAAGDDSAISGPYPFNTLTTPPPVKYNSIMTYNIGMTHGQVSWEAIDGVDEYKLYYAPLATYDPATAPTIITGETWATVSGVHYYESSIGYKLQLQAFYNGIPGELSPPDDKLVRLFLANKPLAPANFQVDEESIAASSATVFWNKEEDATDGYEVAITETSGANPNDSDIGFTHYTTGETYVDPEDGVEKPFTWIRLTGLKADTTYYAWVRSKNKYEPTGMITEGDYVGPINFTTLAPSSTTINLKVLLQGYYNVTTGLQRPATVEVELRNPREVVVATANNVMLGDEGTAAVNFEGIQDGGYFVAIKQVIEGAPEGSNHLPIITQEQVQVTAGDVLNVNLSDPVLLNYMAAYKQDNDANPDAMATETTGDGINLTLMRGGDANGDGNVNMLDFGSWAGANGAQAGTPDWQPAPNFNGDEQINMLDFGVWALNNGKTSYVETQ